MIRILPMLLLIVPVAELMILLEVYRAVANRWGPATGLAVTSGSIVLGALIGVALMRRQGLAVARRLQETTERGEFPTQSLLDGVFVLAGGALLVVPGYVTDVVGLTMLIPWTRLFWKFLLLRWLHTQVQRGTAVIHHLQDANWGAGPSPPGPGAGDRIIDITPHDQSIDKV